MRLRRILAHFRARKTIERTLAHFARQEREAQHKHARVNFIRKRRQEYMTSLLRGQKQ